MLYYKVIHLFFTKQTPHIHFFNIGIYDARKHAKDAISLLKTKGGFVLRPDHFYTIKVLRFKKPKLLNRTYWLDGFTH